MLLGGQRGVRAPLLNWAPKWHVLGQPVLNPSVLLLKLPWKFYILEAELRAVEGRIGLCG